MYVASGIAAAWEARRKGYDDWLFLGVGVLLGPLTLLVLLVLPGRRLAVGTRVRPAAPIALASGGRIPTSHRSVVSEVSEIDGVPVCQISGPDGEPHWVAQEALTRVRRQ